MHIGVPFCLVDIVVIFRVFLYVDSVEYRVSVKCDGSDRQPAVREAGPAWSTGHINTSEWSIISQCRTLYPVTRYNCTLCMPALTNGLKVKFK